MAFFNKKQDKHLVKSLREGCEKSYALLYERYAAKIYAVSRGIHLSHEDAEGIVQEVFLKIWRNRKSLDPALSFNAYLLTIARSLAIKLFKKKARFAAYQHYAISYLQDFSNDTEEYVVFSDLDALSSQALDDLPSKQKQVFMMKNFEHLSTEEISERLQLSKRTVENQIYRASKSLRQKLVAMKVLSWIAGLLALFGF